MHQIDKIRELVRWIRDIAKDHEEDGSIAPGDGDLLKEYARLVGAGSHSASACSLLSR